MHLIRLCDVESSEIYLSRAVLQITQMLGIYHAELARILTLHCNDIGQLAEGRVYLEAGTTAWTRAKQFVLMYEKLFQLFDGEEARVCHWLRRHNPALGAIPLYSMVDDQRIEAVLQLLSRSSS